MFGRRAAERIKFLEAALDGMTARFNRRATLESVDTNGRRIIFRFQRNGKFYTIEAMGTWDDDIEGWRRDLLE